MSRCTLFHSLQFRDVDRALEVRGAVGFAETARFRDERACGGCTCAVRDAEGNQWSCGSYGGEWAGH